MSHFLSNKTDERQNHNPHNSTENNELIVHISPFNHVDVFVVEMVPDQFFEEVQLLVPAKKVSHKLPPNENTLPTGDEDELYIRLAILIL